MPRTLERSTAASVLDRVDPRVLAVAGAACISFSAILMKTSDTAATTAGFFRCLLALPVLVPLALVERRRGPRRWRRQAVDTVAGCLLGVDLVLWGLCIGELGAGIATVLVNVQVVIVPVLALLVHGERLASGFLLVVPVMLLGVALAGGVVGAGVAAQGSSGSAAVRGAAFGVAAGAAYAGYLFLLRGRGAEGERHQAQPILAATFGAGVACLALGPLTRPVDLTPGWPAIGWLAALALSGQVCGWLLIGAALPRLRSNVGATLLLLQPVLAVLFGIALLGERPSAWQLIGCGVVIAAVWFTSSRRDGPPRARREPSRRVAVPNGHP